MRRILLIFGLMLLFALSSCVYGGGGGEPDLGNTPDSDASASETSTEQLLPEIPNEAEDGYSKRY